MTTLADLTATTQIRDLATLTPTQRDDTTERHTLTAIGVPYGVEIDLWDGYSEMFAHGSIDDTGAILRYAHREPLGPIVASKDTPDGRVITAEITPTPRGNEIAAYVDDGVLTRMSIGFDGIEHTVTDRDDGTTLITWTKVRAREYSIVEFPAYDAATITNFRDTTHNQKENPMNNPQTTTADLDALRDDLADTKTTVADLRATLATLRDTDHQAPTIDTRSAGDFLKAYAAGDDATRKILTAMQSRDFNGTTLGADPRADAPQFIHDLTRIIDQANPLKALFASDSLPATGNTIEFSRLASNTVKVAKQDAEGDTLVTGKASIELDTAKVATYGGYTSLSLQAIQRSPSNVLNLHMRAMALAAGANLADQFAAFYAKIVATRADSALTAGASIDALKWKDINALIIDAAQAYSDLAMPLHGLIVDAATFKTLTAKTDNQDRPLFHVSGTGVNTVGEANPKALSADVAGIRLIPNFKQSQAPAEGIIGAFYNSEALRTYTNPVASLQDQNVTNLTQAFSVYQYAAFADEIPAAIVPVKVGA